jgi:hypothetical protein
LSVPIQNWVIHSVYTPVYTCVYRGVYRGVYRASPGAPSRLPFRLAPAAPFGGFLGRDSARAFLDELVAAADPLPYLGVDQLGH